MAKFDSKSFNTEAFGKYSSTIPQPNKNELIKSRSIVLNAEIKNALSSQTGSSYATLPMYGRIGGEPVNYDGNTDITATGLDTYERSVVAIGRAKAWEERDFSYDITAGVDFMSEVAKQVMQYWDDTNTAVLLSIIKGIFAMTGANNLKFVNGHTHDVSSVSTGVVTATTLNSAIQKASGDKKAKFTMCIMHSAVATNLENLNLLEYMKYTDASGIQRSMPLATWNGKVVLIDDNVPSEDIAAVYTASTDTEVDATKTYYTRSGSSGNYVYTEVAAPTGNPSSLSYYELTTAEYTKYTTFVLGDGAFDFADLGAKVPFEMSRDPKTNGGNDTLYSRERLCYAPYGISYKKASQASLSPTNTELENGANWTLVNNGLSGAALKYFDHKEIPIARIVSRG